MIPGTVKPVFTNTRIAPTPSGFLHWGNLFNFLITHRLAEKAGATVLLRIDDIDTERVNQHYYRDIFHVLNQFDIRWQRGPRSISDIEQFNQHTRLLDYEKVIKKLLNKQLLFACNCSRTDIFNRTGTHNYDGHCLNRDLPFDAVNTCWRLNTSKRLLLRLRNLTGENLESFLPPELQFFIVKRRDGKPSYQLASFTDDVLFEIDLVVRGEDLFGSTLAQIYLAEVLNEQLFLDIKFLHHPLLYDARGNKLSKSSGSESLHELMLSGQSREVILNRLIERVPNAWRDFII